MNRQFRSGWNRILIQAGITIILLTQLLLMAAAQGRVRDSGVPLQLVSSTDAPGQISENKLRQCMLQLAREWKLNVNDLPHVIVYHVSKRVAQSVYLDSNIELRRSSSPARGNSFYELWLVGEPREHGYVIGLQKIMEQHFKLEIKDEERDTVVKRVARTQDATIDVQQGK